MWGHLRIPAQRCIVAQNGFRDSAANDHILHALAFHIKAYFPGIVGSDVEVDFFWMIHKHTISSVRKIEWDILVSLLGNSAAVLVPNFNILTIF